MKQQHHASLLQCLYGQDQCPARLGIHLREDHISFQVLGARKDWIGMYKAGSQDALPISFWREGRLERWLHYDEAGSIFQMFAAGGQATASSNWPRLRPIGYSDCRAIPGSSWRTRSATGARSLQASSVCMALPVRTVRLKKRSTGEELRSMVCSFRL